MYNIVLFKKVAIMPIKKTTTEFAKELALQYPKLQVIGEYLHGKAKVEVTNIDCKHQWFVIPQKILSVGTGHRCRVCVKVGKPTKSHTQFVQDVTKMYPTLLVVGTYVNSITKVSVQGSCGHTWEITPNTLQSKGIKSTCTVCTLPVLRMKSQAEVAHEVLNLGLEVISAYTGTNEPLQVQGSCGHQWSVIPNLLINRNVGAKCITCSIAESTRRLQENTTHIVTSIYAGTDKKVHLKCVTCGNSWNTLAGNFLYYNTGNRCEVCIPRTTSEQEKQLLDYIKSKYSGWVVTSDRTLLEGQELDIVLPDLGIAIEYNGTYWHSSKFKSREYHLNKSNNLYDAVEYQLVHISEDNWLHKNAIVLSRVDSLLGLSKRIGARQCSVKRILFPREFLNTNHIQGAGNPSSVNYGLFFNNELAAVMTFAKPKFKTSNEAKLTANIDYELVRYCSLLGTTVTGGASRLLHAFTSEYPGATVLSYSDKQWSQGNVYKKLGFTYSHTSPPGYKYFRGTSSLTRYQCQKHLLQARFPDNFDVYLTEEQIMQKAGYHRVYDCGNDVWVLL